MQLAGLLKHLQRKPEIRREPGLLKPRCRGLVVVVAVVLVVVMGPDCGFGGRWSRLWSWFWFAHVRRRHRWAVVGGGVGRAAVLDLAGRLVFVLVTVVMLIRLLVILLLAVCVCVCCSCRG